MSSFTPIIDEKYQKYAELLLARHQLLLDGKDGDSHTEDIEDRLTELWEKLDDAQQRSLNGVSSDLNWVRRRGALPPKSRKPEEITQADRDSLATAEAGKDGHGVLHYLRVCAPVEPGEALARRRANAYAEIGFPQLASLFKDFAAELDAGR